jgi:ABC-type uncharacterized transport system permease subunit
VIVVGKADRRMADTVVPAVRMRLLVAEGMHPRATSSPRTPLAVMGIVMIVLGVSGLLAGIAWLSVYYLSGTEYPISSLGYGNLAVGFSGICVGLVLGLTGLGLVMVSRR